MYLGRKYAKTTKNSRITGTGFILNNSGSALGCGRRDRELGQDDVFRLHKIKNKKTMKLKMIQ